MCESWGALSLVLWKERQLVRGLLIILMSDLANEQQAEVVEKRCINKIILVTYMGKKSCHIH